MARNMKKYQDFIPKSDAERLLWLHNYVENIREAALNTGTSLGPAAITAHEQEVMQYINAIVDAEQKKIDSKAATSHKEALEKSTIKRIRDVATIIKRQGRKDVGTIAKLGIKCKGYAVDVSALCPNIRVEVAGNKVYIYFNRNHHYDVAVYCRQPGEEFIHIGFGVTSPFIDERPLAVPLQPERREYSIMYNNRRENIGHRSLVASVVYGG